MKRFAFVLVFVLLSTVASAQSIDKWTLRIYNQGASQPISPTPTDLLAANVVCNQTAPTGVTVNPNKVVFDDPVNAGKACIWTDPGTGPLFSVPFGGTYEASLTATNITATSAESTRAPFTRPGLAPAVPTGVHLVR